VNPFEQAWLDGINEESSAILQAIYADQLAHGLPPDPEIEARLAEMRAVKP